MFELICPNNYITMPENILYTLNRIVQVFRMGKKDFLIFKFTSF